MSDAPLFIQGKPRPKTAKALWVTVGCAAAVSVLLRVGGGKTEVELVLGFLGSMLIAVVATLTLYFAVGRRSGDRGGTRDFLLICGAALIAPAIAGALLSGGIMLVSAGEGGEYRRLWNSYMAASAEDQQALIQDMEAYSVPAMLSPNVVSGASGFRKARQQMVDGAKIVDNYRQLAAQRQDDARGNARATPKPDRRKRLLERLERDLAIRQPAEDAYWTLSEELFAKGIAVAEMLERRGVTVSNGKFVFRRQADLDAYNAAVAAYNAAADLQRRQAQSNAAWERGQNR